MKSFNKNEKLLLLSVLGYVYKKLELKEMQNLSFDSEKNETISLLTSIAGKVILMDSTQEEQSNIFQMLSDTSFQNKIIKMLNC